MEEVTTNAKEGEYKVVQMFKKKGFKGYKEFRNEILDWVKTRCLDTIKIIYNPEDDDFIKAFEIEWNKDPKCKNISLETFTHPSFKEKDLVPVGEPILTGKNSKLDSEPKFVYGELIPPYPYVFLDSENQTKWVYESL